jgi:hypothetical protein
LIVLIAILLACILFVLVFGAGTFKTVLAAGGAITYYLLLVALVFAAVGLVAWGGWELILLLNGNPALTDILGYALWGLIAVILIGLFIRHRDPWAPD